MMKRISFLVLLYSLCAAPLMHCQAKGAELELVLTLREGRIASNGALEMGPPFRQSLRLGSDYFYLIQSNRMTVADLGRERWLEIRKNRKILDVPLSAIVDERYSRLMEAGRMIRTMQGLDLATADDDLTPLFNLESRYGMQAGIPLAVYPRPHRIPPNGTVWQMHNVNICEVHRGKTDLPRGFRDIWRCYLAYQWPIHPQVRNEILKERMLPDRIRMRARTPESSFVQHVEIEQVQLQHNTAYTDEIRALRFPTSRIPAEALWRRYVQGRDSLPPRLNLEEMRNGIRKALEYKLYAEALLFAIEIHLQEGASIDSALQALQPALELDPVLLQILRGMELRSVEAAQAACDTLNNLSPSAFARGHVLHAMLGDAYRKAEQPLNAEKAYLLALEANPYLTAVYANLGELYAENGRTREAHLCWEIAQDCTPAHPSLAPLQAKEQKLREEYPDFYLKK